MLWHDIVGHDKIKEVLINALKHNRVAHAYLFYGPKGVGKKTLAGVFAQALVCLNVKEGHPCGRCISCIKAARENHPDIHYLGPSGATIKIEQVREVQKQAQYKPYEAARKIFIIEESEKMTPQAANSLLKVLEEPPGDTVFILLAANSYGLLSTILSRCQQISFNKISDDFNNCREEALELFKKTLQGNPVIVLQAADELEKHKERIPQILEFLNLWYRDLLVWKETGTLELLINRDLVTRIEEEISMFTTKDLISALDKIRETGELIRNNANSRLALEVLLLSLGKRDRNR